MNCQCNVGPVYPEEFGATGDNTADDTAPMQAAIVVAVAMGRTLQLTPGKIYRITSALTASSALFMAGPGTLKATSGFSLLSVGQGSVIDGVTFEGPSGDYSIDSVGISAQGVDNGPGEAPTFLDGLTIRDCSFRDFGRSALRLYYCKNVQITRPAIYNVAWHGVEVASGENIEIVDPWIDGMSGETASGFLNAYGVTFTAISTDRTQNPQSKRCFVRGGVIRNIPTWHAIDFHGGDQCGAEGTIVIDCRRAGIITSLSNAASTNCFLRGIRAYNWGLYTCLTQTAFESIRVASTGIYRCLPSSRAFSTS